MHLISLSQCQLGVVGGSWNAEHSRPRILHFWGRRTENQSVMWIHSIHRVLRAYIEDIRDLFLWNNSVRIWGAFTTLSVSLSLSVDVRVKKSSKSLSLNKSLHSICIVLKQWKYSLHLFGIRICYFAHFEKINYWMIICLSCSLYPNHNRTLWGGSTQNVNLKLEG